MKLNHFSVLMLVFIISAICLSGKPHATNVETKRDETLFLSGANAIAKGEYDQGRIFLNTLINTYPDSPLVEQAKILIFFSYAREGGRRNEKSQLLLQEIEKQLETYKQDMRFR